MMQPSAQVSTPELLLGATRYGFPIDLWSVGCIVGELLLHRPLVPASTEVRQLELLCELLGTPNERLWPDVDALSGSLRGSGIEVLRVGPLARFEADGCRFTLFPDGRTLVEGTDDTGRAQALAARWIGA